MNNALLPPRHKLLQLLIHYLSRSWKARSDCFDELRSLLRNSVMLMKPSPSASFSLIMSLNSSSLKLQIICEIKNLSKIKLAFRITGLRISWQHSNIPRNSVSHLHFYRLSDNLLNIQQCLHWIVNLDLIAHLECVPERLLLSLGRGLLQKQHRGRSSSSRPRHRGAWHKLGANVHNSGSQPQMCKGCGDWCVSRLCFWALLVCLAQLAPRWPGCLQVCIERATPWRLICKRYIAIETNQQIC